MYGAEVGSGFGRDMELEADAAGKDVGGGSKNCGGRLLGRSPAVVTFCNVAYLMGNNTGQLGFSF